MCRRDEWEVSPTQCPGKMSWKTCGSGHHSSFPRKGGKLKRWTSSTNIFRQYLEDPPAPVNLQIPHSTEDFSNPRSSLSSYSLLLLASFHYICWLSLVVFCSLPIMLMLIANKTDIVQCVLGLHKHCKWKAHRENQNHLCKGCVYTGKEHCYPQRASGMSEKKEE